MILVKIPYHHALSVFGKYSGECGLCRFLDDWELIAPDSVVKLVKG